jgi:predicted O-methyltransferase YrrM
MDPAVEALLAEYEAREATEREIQRSLTKEEILVQRENFLISVGRETGMLLNILAKAAQARTILELGTSYGYSTIWLAEAARATGGKVISLDKAPRKQADARLALARAGLADFVEFKAGDALEIIPAMDGPFDFVLVDLWKDLYVPCFDLFLPKLKPGAFIAADNMIMPEYWRTDAEAYRAHVCAQPKIESILLPIGSGVELSRFTG